LTRVVRTLITERGDVEFASNPAIRLTILIVFG